MIKKPVIKSIVKVSVPFLDASNCTEVNEKYMHFLKTIREPSFIPIDLEKVKYISSAIGIFHYSMQDTFEHGVHFMRVDGPIMTVIKLLKWNKIPNFEFLGFGVCPNCKQKGFTYDDYNCKKCGEFSVIEIP